MWYFLWYFVLQCSDLKHVNSITNWEFWCHAQKRNYHKEMKKWGFKCNILWQERKKNTRLICWFMFLLRYPLEFTGLYETIWTLFGIKVEGIAIFGNGPNRADQAKHSKFFAPWPSQHVQNLLFPRRCCLLNNNLP